MRKIILALLSSFFFSSVSQACIPAPTGNAQTQAEAIKSGNVYYAGLVKVTQVKIVPFTSYNDGANFPEYTYHLTPLQTYMGTATANDLVFTELYTNCNFSFKNGYILEVFIADNTERRAKLLHVAGISHIDNEGQSLLSKLFSNKRTSPLLKIEQQRCESNRGVWRDRDDQNKDKNGIYDWSKIEGHIGCYYSPEIRPQINTKDKGEFCIGYSECEGICNKDNKDDAEALAFKEKLYSDLIATLGNEPFMCYEAAGNGQTNSYNCDFDHWIQNPIAFGIQSYVSGIGRCSKKLNIAR